MISYLEASSLRYPKIDKSTTFTQLFIIVNSIFSKAGKSSALLDVILEDGISGGRAGQASA